MAARVTGHRGVSGARGPERAVFDPEREPDRSGGGKAAGFGRGSTRLRLAVSEHSTILYGTLDARWRTPARDHVMIGSWPAGPVLQVGGGAASHAGPSRARSPRSLGAAAHLRSRPGSGEPDGEAVWASFAEAIDVSSGNCYYWYHAGARHGRQWWRSPQAATGGCGTGEGPATASCRWCGGTRGSRRLR